MAAPVINVTQSVLGYRQWEEWEFQPYATNDPTFWICSPLPDGVEFDPDTGRIEGPAKKPGVYTFALRAGNDDGVSEPEVFALGIEAAGFTTPAVTADVVIDVVTRRVGVLANGQVTYSEDPKKAGEKIMRPEAILYSKAGDNLILIVRLVKNGVAVDVPVTGMKLVVKEYDPETVLVESNEFDWVGTGAEKIQRVHVAMESEKLRAALSNYEDDEATMFPALAEFEWTVSNAGGFGPDTLTFTSRTFAILIPRDLAENA
jgi:hypothetical protein